MRIHVAGAIAAAVVFSSSGAFAADPIAAPVEANNWGGFYAGVHVGYGWGDADTSFDSSKYDLPCLFEDANVYDEEGKLVEYPEIQKKYYDKSIDGKDIVKDAIHDLKHEDLLDISYSQPKFGFEDEGDLEGFLGGVQAGFNIQSGHFVFGLEGDISFADLNSDSSFYIATEEYPEDDDEAALWGKTSVDINWLSTLRGRVGYAFDNVLIFATGGLALADIDIEASAGAGYVYDQHCAPDVLYTTSISDDDSDIQAGYVVGGGVEVLFGEKWSVKGEYQFVDLGEEKIKFTDDTSTSVDITLHVVKVGLNYHF